MNCKTCKRLPCIQHPGGSRDLNGDHTSASDTRLITAAQLLTISNLIALPHAEMPIELQRQVQYLRPTLCIHTKLEAGTIDQPCI